MEALTSFPRRLSQLYSATKSSCNAVVLPEAADGDVPVAADLHQRFRVQKDRLMAWGLEFSAPSKGALSDIDESFERAGLTDTVANVMGTIKDILDEAESMRATRPPTTKALGGPKAGQLAAAQSATPASARARYEELAKNLTDAIDVLYTLCRSPPPEPAGPAAKAAESSRTAAPRIFMSPDYNASDLTLTNTFPFPLTPAASFLVGGLPPKLSASDLVLPEDHPPPYESVGGSSSIRVLSRLRQSNSSTNPWKTDGGKVLETPVLVEYAAFDATYQLTHVSPPVERLDAYLAILARISIETPQNGTLSCLGYFEDPDRPRFGLVFELPSFVHAGLSDSQRPIEDLRPVTLLSVLQTGSRSQHSSSSVTPPLEDRFRLANTLVSTLCRFHAENFFHKDVNSSNILLFPRRTAVGSSAKSRSLRFALRSPVLCSFDLFGDYSIDLAPMSTQTPNIYRHPEDPKFTEMGSTPEGPHFDLYSLALVLLEIGLWQPLSDLYKARYTLADFQQRVTENYVPKLASKCGTMYETAVRDCLSKAGRIASGLEGVESVASLYRDMRSRLQRCCLIDHVSDGAEWMDVPTPTSAAVPFKRKSEAPQGKPSIHVDTATHSAYQSAKRWVSEKGSQVLERTRSASSKPSSPTVLAPSTPPQRSPSRSSQHSIRRSISHSLHNLTRSDASADAVDLAGVHKHSALVSSTEANTSSFAGDKGAMPRQEPSSDFTAMPCTRARPPRSEQGSMTFKPFLNSIILLQRRWREHKNRRAIPALVTSSTSDWPQAALGCPDSVTAELPRSIGPAVSKPPPSSPPMEDPPARLRVQATPVPREITDEWHKNMLPRLERLVEKALRKSRETVSIDLVTVSNTRAAADPRPTDPRPTVLVTCTSTTRVKAVLHQRFRYDESIYDLRVRRGHIRRSKAHRSNQDGDAGAALNPFHQQRALCGASIGAYRDEHLPPVSFGGVVLVDNEPLGMTVHHILDAPSEDEDDDGGASEGRPESRTDSLSLGMPLRASAATKLTRPLKERTMTMRCPCSARISLTANTARWMAGPTGSRTTVK